MAWSNRAVGVISAAVLCGQRKKAKAELPGSARLSTEKRSSSSTLRLVGEKTCCVCRFELAQANVSSKETSQREIEMCGEGRAEHLVFPWLGKKTAFSNSVPIS